jgi:hypothetical protein
VSNRQTTLLTVISFCLLFVLIACGGSTSSNSGSSGTSGSGSVSIMSLSQPSGTALSQITLSGSGFDPSSLVWITFSNTTGFSLSLPPLSITQTSIAVPVPLVVNSTTDAPIAGPLSVQVSQFSGSNILTSNSVQFVVMSQLQASSPLPAGSITLGFFQGEITALQNFRQSILGTSQDTAQFETAYAEQITSINQFITQVQSIMNGAPSASLGSINGQNINATASDLANSDAALLAEVKSIASLPQSSSSDITSLNARAKHVQAASSSSSVIQEDAQSLFNIATSNGTTQAELSGAVASLISTSGNNADPNFTQNLLIISGGAFGAGLLIQPAALPVLAVTPLGTWLATAFMEAAPDLQNLEFDKGLAVINALIKPLLPESVGMPYGFFTAYIDSWLVVSDVFCGKVDCSSLVPSLALKVSGSTTVDAAGPPVNASAVLTFQGGSTVDVTNLADWVSSNTNVASIVNPGSAGPISPGIATISASLGSLSAGYTLTVLQGGTGGGSGSTFSGTVSGTGTYGSGCSTSYSGTIEIQVPVPLVPNPQGILGSWGETGTLTVSCSGSQAYGDSGDAIFYVNSNGSVSVNLYGSNSSLSGTGTTNSLSGSGYDNVVAGTVSFSATVNGNSQANRLRRSVSRQ